MPLVRCQNSVNSSALDSTSSMIRPVMRAETLVHLDSARTERACFSSGVTAKMTRSLFYPRSIVFRKSLACMTDLHDGIRFI